MAARNFFRIGNLTALREMALRLTAEHVDHKLQDYMQVKRIAGPWKSGERLMVAVGPSPFSERRCAGRGAWPTTWRRPGWRCTSRRRARCPAAEQAQLARNLELARSLGGEVVTTAGSDVAAALVHVARQRNVTQIVAGKPTPLPWWNLGRRLALVNDLIRTSGDIDIYVVSGERRGRCADAAPRCPPTPSHSHWTSYAWSLAIVAASRQFSSWSLRPTRGSATRLSG